MKVIRKPKLIFRNGRMIQSLVGHGGHPYSFCWSKSIVLSYNWTNETLKSVSEW